MNPSCDKAPPSVPTELPLDLKQRDKSLSLDILGGGIKREFLITNLHVLFIAP